MPNPKAREIVKSGRGWPLNFEIHKKIVEIRIAQGRRYRKWSQRRRGRSQWGKMVKTGKVFSNQILQNGQKKWKIEPDLWI